MFRIIFSINGLTDRAVRLSPMKTRSGFDWWNDARVWAGWAAGSRSELFQFRMESRPGGARLLCVEERDLRISSSGGSSAKISEATFFLLETE